MNKVIIVNRKRLEKLKEVFKESGSSSWQIITDFDRTLTKSITKGRPTPSLISILRDNNILGNDYINRAKLLADKYYPLEHDLSISEEKRNLLMEEWWYKHFNLLIELKLNKDDIYQAINVGQIELRNEVDIFFDIVKKHGVPITIISAGGLGEESINYFLKKAKLLSDNVNVIANNFIWNTKGYAIGVQKPIIHSLNKGVVVLSAYPFWKKIKERKNVILLGDSLSDVEMVKGFSYDRIIKIAFINSNNEDSLKKFKEVFDIIIKEDSFVDVNNLILEILNK